MIYAVLEIQSNTIRYTGRSCVGAAKVLEPGTCFGSGKDELQALATAHKWAAWFRSKEPLKEKRA